MVFSKLNDGFFLSLLKMVSAEDIVWGNPKGFVSLPGVFYDLHIIMTEYINIDVSKIKIPSSVLDETKDYIEENNPIIYWLQSNIHITNNPKDRIKTSDMHRNYNEAEDNEKRLSSIEFSKYMKFNGFEYKTIRGQRYYKGCIFVQPDQDKEMREVTNDLDFV